jgi:ubiquinone/menaquinone biosynthesis C-methylase UbiE
MDFFVTEIDDNNISFWNELCGTGLARQLGIVDQSVTSLKKFDDWYFDLYPYLFAHIPFDAVNGKKVLEIGLGYGTVAARLMEVGAQYHGLDIADGPVAMAQHRATLLGKVAEIQKGSALSIPYADGTFDQIVTIGCLHHTGDLALALSEVARVTKPGGGASIMLYNALSYRQWQSAPVATYRRSKPAEIDWSNADTRLRRAYDINQEGAAAPSTTFISAREATDYLGRYYKSVLVTPRNIGSDLLPARVMPRSLARVCFESWLGLDLYIECVK